MGNRSQTLDTGSRDAVTPPAPSTAMADELCRSHLYLVDHVLNRLMARFPRHADRDDLWSAGAHGLVEASRRYDPDTGVPFAAYATRRIHGAIIDATRLVDWSTRRLRRTMRRIDATTQSLRHANGGEPTTQELADALDMTVEELASHRRDAASSTLLHLDQPVGEDGSLEDFLPNDRREDSPERQLEHRELVGSMLAALPHLPDDQRAVLERHFFGGELFRDIATDLGVTEARVSQLRAEALNALRASLSEGFDGIEEVDPDAPGKRRRATFVAEVATHTTWRARLEAADRAPSRAAYIA